MKPALPFPLFDTADFNEDLADYHLHPSIPLMLETLPLDTQTLSQDHEISRRFLQNYVKVSGTYNRYRTEIQRFLNYLWIIAGRTLGQTDHETVDCYLKWLLSPPNSWISPGILSAFRNRNGLREPNPDWRPFSYRIKTEKKTEATDRQPKTATQAARLPKYTVSSATIKACKASLRLFFQYLVEQDYLMRDPLAGIRKRRDSGNERVDTSSSSLRPDNDVPRFSDNDWGFILRTIRKLADENSKYERNLFVMVSMKALYLRVSELSKRKDTEGYWREPVFGDFKHNPQTKIGDVTYDDYWTFTIRGKGAKTRHVTVPDSFLPYLERWRQHLGHDSPLPMPEEQNPVLPSSHGGNLSTRSVALIYEESIQLVAKFIENTEGKTAFFNTLMAAKSNTHRLRHTGISQAINNDPSELRFISEEAGHANPSFTEKIYVSSDSQAKRQSGKKRQI